MLDIGLDLSSGAMTLAVWLSKSVDVFLINLVLTFNLVFSLTQ